MSTRHEHNTSMKNIAADAFRTHELVADNLMSWKIQKRDKEGRLSGTHAAHIAALGNYLVVVGDIDTVVFGYGSTAKGPRGLVNWIGRSTTAGYVAEKARIGMTCQSEPVMEWDEDVAEAELRDHLREEEESSNIETIKEAITFCSDGPHAVAAALGAKGDLWEILPSDVIAPRVFYAWAAVARLADLLDEQDELELNEEEN